jgi:hypothetical protein
MTSNKRSFSAACWAQPLPGFSAHTTRAPAGRRVHYQRRRPKDTVLYQLVQEHIQTFLAQVELETAGLPRVRQRRVDAFLAPTALPRARQMSLQISPTQEAPPTPGAVSNEQGFSLHAEVSCAARDPAPPWPLLARDAKTPRNIASRADERLDNAQAEDRLDGSRAQQYYAS